MSIPTPDEMPTPYAKGLDVAVIRSLKVIADLKIRNEQQLAIIQKQAAEIGKLEARVEVLEAALDYRTKERDIARMLVHEQLREK